MISRSDWEPLCPLAHTPTLRLSPFALARPGTFLRVGFFAKVVYFFSLPPCGVCLLCGCRWFIL